MGFEEFLAFPKIKIKKQKNPDLGRVDRFLTTTGVVHGEKVEKAYHMEDQSKEHFILSNYIHGQYICEKKSIHIP